MNSDDCRSSRIRERMSKKRQRKSHQLQKKKKKKSKVDMEIQEIKDGDFPGGTVIRICLPLQQGSTLAQGGSTCLRATKPLHHNY